MNAEEAAEALSSESAFIRAGAAQWLAAHRSPSQRVAIADALNRESVPQIRRHLSSALQLSGQPETGVPAKESTTVDESAQILDYLGSLINHETEPAIGWLRLAAEDEIDAFPGSETEKSIEILRRRIDGVAAIARANRQPTFRRESLIDLVEQSLPPEQIGAHISVSALSDTEDWIETDGDLFAVILGNAITNAMFASQSMGQDEQVLIELATSRENFMITLTNRFSGASFSMEDMGGLGTSTRTGGRGLGILAMRVAAERLAYELSVTGDGGVATTSLRGARRHG